MSKGAVTRQEIIRQAAPVFNQRGFAGATMHDIMQATGLEKGGIYRHFSSKQELAAEAFRYALGLSAERRAEHLDNIDGALNKLRRTIKAFVEVPSPVAGGCVLMNTAIDADDTNPELRGLAREGVRAWKDRLAAIVRQGVERGEIARGTDPERVANQLVAALEGALMISRLEGSRAALEDVRAWLESMVDGLAAPA